MRERRRGKTGCRLTRSGIDLLVNHELNEDIAARKRYGVRGTIALGEVDTMVACFVATRAQDFLLDDWRQRFDYQNNLSSPAQRYLQTCIDDMAAYARMISRIPFAKLHFEAYLSRAAAHVMASEPLHIQLMRTLRLYLFEDQPNVVVSPLIVECLGTAAAMDPRVAALERLLFDESLSYSARHNQAARLITPLFTRMIKLDEEALSFYDLVHLYDNEQSYGASKDAANDENALRQEANETEFIQASLATVNEGNIDQLIADNNEAPVEAGKTPSLSLPSMSAEAKAMAFLDDGRASYERTAERYHDTIEAHCRGSRAPSHSPGEVGRFPLPRPTCPQRHPHASQHARASPSQLESVARMRSGRSGSGATATEQAVSRHGYIRCCLT